MSTAKIKKRRISTIIKTYVILAMFCVQLILIGFSSVSAISNNSNDSEKTLDSSNGSVKTSDISTPYFIPVNQSTPISSQDPNDPSPSSIPQSSNYYTTYSYTLSYAFSINPDKYVVKQGETITIDINLNHNLIPCQNYVVNVKIYKGFYRSGYSYENNYYTAQLVYSNYHQTNSSGEVSFPYSVTDGEGLYTIYAGYSNIYSYSGFTVGETGLFFRGSQYYSDEQKYTASIQVVNTTNFSPLGTAHYSYNLELYNKSSGSSQYSWISVLNGTGMTNDYGYSIFTTDPIPYLDNYYNYYYGTLKLVINATFDSYSVVFTTFIYKSWDYYYYSWSGEHQANTDRIQYIVTTDKTLYSPGETIHLRALILDYSFLNETKLPIQNQTIQLTVYNPDDLAIFWLSLETDEYGVLNFQFPLDQDNDLGQYGFKFNYQNTTYRYDINVEQYTKPVFQVTIDTNGKDFYPPDSGIFGIFNPVIFEGNVYVEYYFGQPVVGANVKLYLRDWSGNIRYTFTGMTDGQGKSYFSIDLNRVNGLTYTFTATANVTDMYGRIASFEKAYSRIDQIYISRYLDNWAPKPNDTVKCYFSVLQLLRSNGNNFFSYSGYNYNPLQNVTANINIYGIRDYPIVISVIRDKTLINSYQRVTDEFGSAQLDFKLPPLAIAYYQFFKIEISVTLNDGRSVTGSLYFRYQKYSIDINLHSDHLKSGGTLDFDVAFKDNLLDVKLPGEVVINIYDSRYHFIGSTYISISQSATLHFKLPNYTPQGQYYIYSYVYSRPNSFFGGFRYSSTSKTFYVGDKYDISLSTNKTASNENPNEFTMKLGETLLVTGKTNVFTNMPYYLEIFKRGLVASQRLDVVGDSFSFSIKISELLSSAFTIMVYTISSTGNIVQDCLVVHVTSDYGFNISTDKPIYKPGDSITLTITPNTTASQLFSISFIDSSLLAIAPEDDSELDYFSTSSYYTYIESSSSWGFGIDSHNYWWAGYEYNTRGFYIYLQPISGSLNALFTTTPSDLKGNIILPSFDQILHEFNTEVRKNITESANWIPEMVISKPTNITFDLPDNIGEWTIRMFGNNIGNPSESSLNQNVLWGNVVTTKIKTFLPFFVEFDIPQPVIQDDILSIKAYVYNYLGTNIEALVAINAPDLVVLNDKTQSVKVPNGFVSEVEFSVYCSEAFLHNITIIAATNVTGVAHSDAKQLPVYIQPNGIDLQNRKVNFLNATNNSYSFNYSVDSSAIYHKEILTLYPDIMDISIENWQLLIGYPYGCIEQTISKLLPTTLIYNYLNSTGQLTENLKQKMNLMILEGLNRIYSFQHFDGGWGWWRYDYSMTIMTAKVLSVLGKISDIGFQISPTVISNAVNFLIRNQNSDGTWKFYYYRNDFSKFEDTAYVLNSLISVKNLVDQASSSISSAINSLQSLWQTQDYRSPIGAALFYLTTKNTVYENATFNNLLISYLLSSKINNGDMTYWSSVYNYYYYNLGGSVEITAYVAWALALDDYLGHMSIIQNSIRYILNRQSIWGWSNTADTSAAIESLTELKSYASQIGIIDFNGTVKVDVNGADNPQFEINITQNTGMNNNFALRLDKYIVPGENSINITLNGTGSICYTLQSQQILRANPQVEVNNGSEVINIESGEFYYITVNVNNINPKMHLTDTNIELEGIPADLKIPELDYNRYFKIIDNNTIIKFLIQAPNKTGSYSISGVNIVGTILYQNLNNSSQSKQFYRTFIGNIIVNVLNSKSQKSESDNIDAKTILQGIYEQSEANYIKSLMSGMFSSLSPSPSSSTLGNITITKQMSKLTRFIPGNVINCTIQIENKGDPIEFYAIDDIIPTGTQLVPGSFWFSNYILSKDNSWAITMDEKSDGIHFFLPLIPTGITKVNYQIQVVSVRNSNTGQCTLWGMYDNFSVSTTAQVLESLPIKYNLNNSMYQDLIHPSIIGMNISQIEKSSDIEVKIELSAYDGNTINKVRISYAQGSNWQTKTLYTNQNLEDLSFILRGFKNINSKVSVLVDVFDAYGNVISSQIHVINVISKIIPYAAIGIAFGLCLGLAGVVTTFYKKRMLKEKKEELTENLETDTRKQISFLDED